MTDSDVSRRYAVILAGGRGARLWPVSTLRQPKQFQALGDSRPLIAQTFERLARCVAPDHILVSTTAEYADDVLAWLPDLDRANLIIEPVAQGKPAAFLLIAHRLQQLDPDAVVLTAASDSFVSPVEDFLASCERAYRFVEEYPDWTAVLGSTPTRPDVSLGYINASGRARGVEGVLVARDFVEKPGRDEVAEFLTEPDYFWNSSHYCFAASTFLAAYQEGAPELSAAIDGYLASGVATDYVATGSPHQELLPLIDAGWPIGVVACDFRWYDIGTWPSLYRALADREGTAFVSAGQDIDASSHSGLVVNDSHLSVITAGLDGVAVVVTDQAVLVANIAQLEETPGLLAALEERFDAAHREDRDRDE